MKKFLVLVLVAVSSSVYAMEDVYCDGRLYVDSKDISSQDFFVSDGVQVTGTVGNVHITLNTSKSYYGTQRVVGELKASQGLVVELHAELPATGSPSAVFFSTDKRTKFRLLCKKTY